MSCAHWCCIDATAILYKHHVLTDVASTLLRRFINLVPAGTVRLSIIRKIKVNCIVKLRLCYLLIIDFVVQ